MVFVVIVALLAATCAGYAVAALGVRRAGSKWRRLRILAFVAGVLLIGVALVPPIATRDEKFTVHVGQHLLLGMFAPLALALGAPVTLLLRILPAQGGRLIVRILRHAAVRVLTHPVTAAGLNVGGLWLLYWTPLYSVVQEHAVLHAILHLHFLFTGCLFTWSLIGIDPMPHRASLGIRVAVLVGASAAHGVIAKLLYAHGPLSWQSGAKLMWYGGDVLDVLLLSTLLWQWFMREGKRLQQGQQFRSSTAAGTPVE
ncbi:MAG: cytochrome c oxidase assembly protein [Herpetosiphon sp.]